MPRASTVKENVRQAILHPHIDAHPLGLYS
jgi:hypothetical protein